jgi:drug/metabolite transporter (DMT)-like permease
VNKQSPTAPRRAGASIGLGLAIFSGVLFGTNGPVAGFLMKSGLDPIAVSAFRSLLTAVLMVAWTLAHARGRPRMDGRALALAAIGGVAMCGNFGFFFISIDYAGVTIAVIVKAVAPLLIVAIAVAFGLERASFGKLAGVVLVFLGIAMVSTG